MKGYLKPILILLGLAVIGYAIFAKLSIQSPVSAWENTLGNDVRKGDADHCLAFFREIINRVEASWNPVLVLGVLIVLAACFLKTRNGK